MDHLLRTPCGNCGASTGTIETRHGQDCVFCQKCKRWQYNAPKTETGRTPRTLATARCGIKVGQRARIMLRASGRCEICGQRPDGVDQALHVGHLLSLKDGFEHGVSEADLNSDENLAAMCEQCNLGLGSETVPLRLAIGIVMARVKHSGKAF